MNRELTNVQCLLILAACLAGVVAVMGARMTTAIIIVWMLCALGLSALCCYIHDCWSPRKRGGH